MKNFKSKSMGTKFKLKKNKRGQDKDNVDAKNGDLQNIHTCVKHGGVVYVQPIYKADMDKAYVRLSCELHVQSTTQISDCISHTFSRQEADNFFPS
jgi:hypothetical protein